jgi:serine phosphatase RsbU (regulator of sigma subunit)
MSDQIAALDYFLKSTSVSEKRILNLKKNTKEYSESMTAYGSALINICTVYKDMCEYPKAISAGLKALKIYDDLMADAVKEHDEAKVKNLKKAIASIYGNVGTVFQSMPDHKQALTYFEKSYNIFKEIDNKKGMAMVKQNMGISYTYIDIDKSMACQWDAVKILEEVGAKIPLGNAYSSLALALKNKKEYNKAIEYELKALKIFEEVNYQKGMSGANGGLATNYLYLKDYKTAKKYAEAAMDLQNKYGIIEHVEETSFILSEIYSGLGDFKNAYDFHLRYSKIKDSLSTTEKEKDVLRQTMNFDFKKKELADSLLVAEDKKITLVQLKQEKTQRFALYGGLLLTVLFGIFIFNRFRLTQKQKHIIEIKNKETEEQKAIIEEHQKETIDSINYAKRIQYALLANNDMLNQNLQEHFILFKPKDIVSGDFYWATTHQNKFYLAVCDSTGHGVPGAFMSLLNIGFLSEAINEKNIVKPNEILNYVRKRLIESIGVDGQNDGMDAILVCIDKIENSISYAAANNDPILISYNKLIELPKDKMPVGKGEKADSFTLHTIEYKKGDALYLYTDGFADQFGGPKGKKYKYKQLNELLVKNYNLPISKQMEILDKNFSDWKGDLEQVDDVCVIGIRL